MKKIPFKPPVYQQIHLEQKVNPEGHKLRFEMLESLKEQLDLQVRSAFRFRKKLYIDENVKKNELVCVKTEEPFFYICNKETLIDLKKLYGKDFDRFFEVDTEQRN